MHRLIQTLEDVERELARLTSSSGVHGKGLTTERTFALAAACGNPHTRLRVVHLAGTSGKTSTAYFIASMLGEAGRKIGLTVSPHIDSIAERVQINGAPLTEAKFCRYFTEFYPCIKQADFTPSYFELMIVFAYWVFDKENVDYAVIETGMGGLHDSTNIARQPDKLCIITDIGLDHIHVLGRTIQEIAAQKAGIIAPGNDAVMYHQPSVRSAVRVVATRQRAKLHEIETTTNTSAMPDYQYRNWWLAKRAFDMVRMRDKLLSLDDRQLLSTQRRIVPARMDEVVIDGRTLLYDGAHNPQKMQAFRRSVVKKYPDKTFAVLLALKETKDVDDVAEEVAKFATTAIVTNFTLHQDMQVGSMPTAEIGQALKSRSITTHLSESSLDGLRVLFGCEEDVLVVTGSFYLIAEIRKLIKTKSS